MPNTEPENPAIHVAVGVVINECSQVLVALRPDKLHQGGLWEFPGGKVESGENGQSALVREFLEEVSLQLEDSAPLMTVSHDYGDKRVFLDVWICRQYTGVAQGKEGQQVRWAGKHELAGLQFPAANTAILQKVISLLPD